MQLGLLLLKEAKQGYASKFHPWIQSLPVTFDTLKHWSEAEMDELQTGTMPGEQLKSQVGTLSCTTCCEQAGFSCVSLHHVMCLLTRWI